MSILQLVASKGKKRVAANLNADDMVAIAANIAAR
jgi:hypothetical protein